MECKRSTFLSILILGIVFGQISAAKTKVDPALEGGFKPILNQNDPRVVVIGQFAVAEHNRIANDHVNFLYVLRAIQQEVEGVNYKMVIKGYYDGGLSEYIEVEVYENLSNELSLISFEVLQGGGEH